MPSQLSRSINELVPRSAISCCRRDACHHASVAGSCPHWGRQASCSESHLLAVPQVLRAAQLEVAGAGVAPHGPVQGGLRAVPRGGARGRRRPPRTLPPAAPHAPNSHPSPSWRHTHRPGSSTPPMLSPACKISEHWRSDGAGRRLCEPRRKRRPISRPAGSKERAPGGAGAAADALSGSAAREGGLPGQVQAAQQPQGDPDSRCDNQLHSTLLQRFWADWRLVLAARGSIVGL